MFIWTLEKHIERKNEELGLELTQGQIAHSANLSRYTVSMMINKKPFRQIRASSVQSLMRFFNCNYEELFIFVEEEDIPNLLIKGTLIIE